MTVYRCPTADGSGNTDVTSVVVTPLVSPGRPSVRRWVVDSALVGIALLVLTYATVRDHVGLGLSILRNNGDAINPALLARAYHGFQRDQRVSGIAGMAV